MLSRNEIKEARQRAVNEAFTFLIAQGKPGMTGTTCHLRGAGGEKCAIGLFIPDDIYRPDMEKWALDQVSNVVPTWLADCGIEFLRQLRGAHDGAAVYTNPDAEWEMKVRGNFIEVLRERFLNLVLSYGLKLPEGV